MTEITRRNILRGTAWSVPAIVAAKASPAFAASPKCPTVNISRGRIKTVTSKTVKSKVYDRKKCKWVIVYNYTTSVTVPFLMGTWADVIVTVDGALAVFSTESKAFTVTSTSKPKTVRIVTKCDDKELFNGRIDC